MKAKKVPPKVPRGRGRPKKSGPRKELISVYFEPGEVAQIVTAAETEHMSASSWVARAARGAIKTLKK